MIHSSKLKFNAKPHNDAHHTTVSSYVCMYIYVYMNVYLRIDAYMFVIKVPFMNLVSYPIYYNMQNIVPISTFRILSLLVYIWFLNP